MIVTESHLANTTLLTNISKELFQVNYLVAYPLSDAAIEGWTNCILELRPQTTIEELRSVINKMKTGEIEYDTKKGIQNIFRGIKELNPIKRIEADEIFGNTHNK